MSTLRVQHERVQGGHSEGSSRPSQLCSSCAGLRITEMSVTSGRNQRCLSKVRFSSSDQSEKRPPSTQSGIRAYTCVSPPVCWKATYAMRPPHRRIQTTPACEDARVTGICRQSETGEARVMPRTPHRAAPDKPLACLCSGMTIGQHLSRQTQDAGAPGACGRGAPHKVL